MGATIRENLLVSMAMYAGDMMRCNAIKLPYGTVGEDELAGFCVDCVDNFMQSNMDIPFDQYAISCLASRFPVEDEYDEDELEYTDTGWKEPTHRVLAVAGRVEKVLFEGSHEQCEMFCDDFNWEWSETPGGFVWDLEVEEI